jgi:hypothetical protein
MYVQGMNGRESEEKEKKRKAGAIHFFDLLANRSKGLHFYAPHSGYGQHKEMGTSCMLPQLFLFHGHFDFLCIRRIYISCVFAGE